MSIMKAKVIENDWVVWEGFPEGHTFELGGGSFVGHENMGAGGRQSYPGT